MIYMKPAGSLRLGLQVKEYDDHKQWLGISSSGTWAVAYHGSNDAAIADVVRDGGLDVNKSRRALYGRGNYLTPDASVAKAYAKVYEYKDKKFKVVIQARVNPDQMKVVPREENGSGGDYYVVPQNKDVRIYELCIYPVE